MEIRDGDMLTEPGATLVYELWCEMEKLYADDPTAPETNGETDDLRNEELLPPTGRFLIVYEDDQPIASGAIRRRDDATAEIKRMYVRPEARGRGISRMILNELEATARRSGYRALVLETGARQPEAIALYESAGYTTIPNFGFYKESPLSACYRKELTSGTS